MKIGFVGIGKVGATAAYTSLLYIRPKEIAVVDVAENLVIAETLELNHAACGLNLECKIEGSTSYSILKNADIIVVTAGLARTAETKSRLDLIEKNKSIIKEVCENIKREAPNSMVLMVSNPVDVLTYYAYKNLDLPRNKIFGMGSLLDSIRLRYYSKSKEGFMIGEHGDAMTAVKCSHEEAIKFTQKTGPTLIKLKGYTCFGPAVAINVMLRSILYNEKKTLPTSCVLDGEYGLRDMALGVPAVLGKNGIEKIVELKLNVKEEEELRKAASVIRQCL